MSEPALREHCKTQWIRCIWFLKPEAFFIWLNFSPLNGNNAVCTFSRPADKSFISPPQSNYLSSALLSSPSICLLHRFSVWKYKKSKEKKDDEKRRNTGVWLHVCLPGEAWSVNVSARVEQEENHELQAVVFFHELCVCFPINTPPGRNERRTFQNTQPVWCISDIARVIASNDQLTGVSTKPLLCAAFIKLTCRHSSIIMMLQTFHVSIRPFYLLH